jgi:hypothetical protein
VSAKTWLLVVLAVGMASCAALVGVVGPRLARGFIVPISRMKSEQQEFERWVEQKGFQEPQIAQVDAAQLDRFLALRKLLLEVEARGQDIGSGMPQDRRPSLDEISGLMQGVQGVVTGQLEAYRRHEMPPKEYEYLRKLVYRQWLQPLRERGHDPAVRQAAARELDATAGDERDPTLQRRLQKAARQLRERRPPAPDGIPEPVHELLCAKAVEIQALANREPVSRRRR